MNNNTIKNLIYQAKKVKRIGLKFLDKTRTYLSGFNISKKIKTINIHFSLPRVKSSFYIGLIFIIGLSLFFIINPNSDQNLKTASLANIKIESGLPQISDIDTNKAQAKNDFNIASQKEEEPTFLTSSNGASLVPPKSDFQASAPKTRTKIETYIVKPGDTVSTIARKFGLYWSTILWENDLSSWSVIQPGQELKILPTDGITHKVKKGENISYIAKKYKSSVQEISKFNNLGDNISPGQTLIIPDGSPPPKPKPKPQPSYTVDHSHNYNGYWDWWNTTNCHKFIARQCTSWAAYKWASQEKQCVPSWGNAETWYYNAKSAGYTVSSRPRSGAIMYLTCTSWLCQAYGHVAYVENYDSSHVTISEMNGLNRRAYSDRTLLNKTGVWQNGWKILGYIYPLQ